MTEACLDSKELNSEDIESEMEHREVPTGEAAVKSSETMKKRHGPVSSCWTTWRAEGTDPRRLWFPEEVGYHLQEGVPSYSSGTAQEERLQDNSDPGKLWTVEVIGHSWREDDPQYKSDMVQGT
jgi:hypothetical protein